MPQTLPDHEISEKISSLNSRPREVFIVVHRWAKGNVNYDGHNVKLIHIFSTGSRGTDKSHLVNAIYNAI